MSDITPVGDSGRTVPVSRAASSPVIENVNWEAVEQDNDFRTLIQQKRNFIIPATIFFLVYYFAFLILVGYFPDIVNVKVFGNINVAYLLALSQFIMVWVLMYLYVRRAGTFDKLSQGIVTKIRGGK